MVIFRVRRILMGASRSHTLPYIRPAHWENYKWWKQTHDEKKIVLRSISNNINNDQMMQLNKTKCGAITSFTWHRKSPIKIVLMRQTIATIFSLRYCLLGEAEEDWECVKYVRDASIHTHKYGYIYICKTIFVEIMFLFSSFFKFYFIAWILYAYYYCYCCRLLPRTFIQFIRFNSNGGFIGVCVCFSHFIRFFSLFFLIPMLGTLMLCIRMGIFGVLSSIQTRSSQRLICIICRLNCAWKWRRTKTKKRDKKWAPKVKRNENKKKSSQWNLWLCATAQPSDNTTNKNE